MKPKEFLLIVILSCVLVAVILKLSIFKSKQNMKVTTETTTAFTTIIPKPTPTVILYPTSKPLPDYFNQVNIFYKNKKYSSVKIGEKIDDLIVKSINPNPATYKKSNNTNLIDDITILFDGEVSLRGKYVNGSLEPAILSDETCFYVDKDQLQLIPRFEGDPRNDDVWFCFDNTDFAQKEFSPKGSKGNATIVINDYFIIYRGMMVWNTATLVSVKNKN